MVNVAVAANDVTAKFRSARIGLLTSAAAALISYAASGAEVTPTGEPETVYDHATQACEDVDIPDAAAHAFRDSQGNIQLIAAHYITYRMVGKDFSHLKKDCSTPAMRSDFNPDPSKFSDHEWLVSPYTLDGKTVYGIVHDEYHPWEHKSPPFDDATYCDVAANARLTSCWYNAITMPFQQMAVRPTPPHAASACCRGNAISLPATNGKNRDICAVEYRP